MGEEGLIDERIAILKKFKVTKELMAMTGKQDAIYLHCLPTLHDQCTEIAVKHPEIHELENDVFEMENSLVFDEARTECIQLKHLWY